MLTSLVLLSELLILVPYGVEGISYTNAAIIIPELGGIYSGIVILCIVIQACSNYKLVSYNVLLLRNSKAEACGGWICDYLFGWCKHSKLSHIRVTKVMLYGRC